MDRPFNAVRTAAERLHARDLHPLKVPNPSHPPHQKDGSGAAHHDGHCRYQGEPPVSGAHGEQPEEGAGQGARDGPQEPEGCVHFTY